ncbi:hypothetical protein DU756_24120, partial [Salmonella enterica subsp. enterica]|nr:hypothetical protein [Salmonella enterica subsp. enterica serovar Enteritidis]
MKKSIVIDFFIANLSMFLEKKIS